MRPLRQIQPSKRKPTRTDRVRRTFSLGCRLLLGFRRVSFWEKPPRKGAQRRRLGIPAGARPVESSFHLPDRPIDEIGRVWVTADGNSVIMILRGNHHDCPIAAVVGDPEVHANRSRTRTQLLVELFEEFRSAYHHALDVDASERRVLGEGHLSDVVAEVLAGLGREVQTRRGVVEIAVRTLGSKLGYSRVLVSLISPDRKRLTGFYEFPSTDDQKLLKATDYSLDPPDSSLHVRAVRDRKSIPAPDFRSDSRANQEAVARSEIDAGAVILLDTGRTDAKGEPYYLGTFLVERADGLPPDRDEFDALVAFGHKFCAGDRARGAGAAPPDDTRPAAPTAGDRGRGGPPAIHQRPGLALHGRRRIARCDGLEESRVGEAARLVAHHQGPSPPGPGGLLHAAGLPTTSRCNVSKFSVCMAQPQCHQ